MDTTDISNSALHFLLQGVYSKTSLGASESSITLSNNEPIFHKPNEMDKSNQKGKMSYRIIKFRRPTFKHLKDTPGKTDAIT